ncbi:hypothetical protein Cal7507_5884 [Calothrix sp. PCC 7507]|nr:hypothetical protein Cal7507_5884 [Calothrix sp. PCC 7507]
MHPVAWFRPLALGCWIVPGSPSLLTPQELQATRTASRTRGGTTNARACRRQAIAKTTGLCDYFSTRCECERSARNDNFIGSRKLETLADRTCVYTVGGWWGVKYIAASQINGTSILMKKVCQGSGVQASL